MIPNKTDYFKVNEQYLCNDDSFCRYPNGLSFVSLWMNKLDWNIEMDDTNLPLRSVDPS